MRVPHKRSEYDVDPSTQRTPYNPFRNNPAFSIRSMGEIENEDETMDMRDEKIRKHLEDMQRLEPERYEVPFSSFILIHHGKSLVLLSQ